MKALTIIFSLIAIAAPSAIGSAIKFDAEDAATAIAKAAAIFEARATEIEKIFRLEDGTAVSEAEIEKLERPSPGVKKLVLVRISYKVTFEITRSIRGAREVGDTFELTWNDTYRSMCPHFETRMLRGNGIWSIEKDTKGTPKYRPFPENAGTRMKIALKIETESGPCD
jgi:hypothetical protein